MWADPSRLQVISTVYFMSLIAAGVELAKKKSSLILISQLFKSTCSHSDINYAWKWKTHSFSICVYDSTRGGSPGCELQIL